MEISEEDRKLLDAFKALHVQPKTDTTEDLKTWIKEFGHVLENQSVAAAPAAATYTVSNNPPRLPIFYGDTETLTKGECKYEQWIYEVKSLVREETFKDELIMLAIRRSLRGDAYDILMSMPSGSDIKEIIEQFESVYGLFESKATILSKFYGATQREDEDTTAWSCRLEKLCKKLLERDFIDKEDMNEMLCDTFWKGLRQDVKDITGYKFENIDNFHKLRVEIRKIEQERMMAREDKKEKTLGATAKSAVFKESVRSDEMQELKDMMKTMTATMKTMGDNMAEMTNINRQQHSHDRNRSTSHYQDRRTEQEYHTDITAEEKMNIHKTHTIETEEVTRQIGLIDGIQREMIEDKIVHQKMVQNATDADKLDTINGNVGSESTTGNG